MPLEESKEILVECLVKAFVKVIEAKTGTYIDGIELEDLTSEVHRCLEDFVNIKIIQGVKSDQRI